jgi:hypothetical protein
LPSSARAITFGQLDTTNRFPHVGALIFEFDGEPAILCSGTLIEPDVFLTAAPVTLDAPVDGVTPARLPPATFLDPISLKLERFTAVGSERSASRRPRTAVVVLRRSASVRRPKLQVTGPHFLGTFVVAVTVTGDRFCRPRT